MKHPFYLSYNNQADKWGYTLPLRNGRIGAMVYGHTGIERIQLNDDSLRYGKFMDRNKPSLKEKLPEIRKLVLSGDIYHAEELIMQYMAGTPACMPHYTLLGELDIALNQHLPFTTGWMPHSSGATEYFSNLDLMEGALNINHIQEGIGYHREMFISYPDQVMCIHYNSDTLGKINPEIMMNRIGISDATEMDDRRPGKRVSAGDRAAPFVDSIRTMNVDTIEWSCDCFSIGLFHQ